MARSCLSPALAASLVLFGPPRLAAADDASDEALIRAATRGFVEAWNARDLDRLLLFYADDYVDVNLPEPRQSKAERRVYLSRILERRDATLEVTPDEVVVSGEHAFVRGTILLRRTTREGATVATRLRYVDVLRRFPQGWKAIWGIDAEVYPASRR
jgi:ketosteroid isomerase-like protein